MGRVMEEARTRGVRSVYAYVSVDNKVGHSLTLTRSQADWSGPRIFYASSLMPQRYLKGYFVPFAGSSWHKGADNRSFPCIKERAKGTKWGSFACLELVLHDRLA